MGQPYSPFAAAFSACDVLVTGAGGSIGSALVKTLAREKPRSLTLLDSSEENLFAIQRDMETMHPDVSCDAILGSVGDVALLDDIFHRFHPEIVFHVAAFKHVALLERNLITAINNNTLGSYALVRTAVRHGGSRVIVVSTDKAVRPHSVMGVSKRLAELLTLSSSTTACRVDAIRLGNVIGSNHSVIPIFLDQIEKGDVVTVRHPQASRYFLSRKEAVNAILAAAVGGDGGSILLPALGNPVCIAELARYLWSVRTNRTEAVVPFCFTGLRPGEKVTEDLIGPDEMSIGTIDGPLTVLRNQTLNAAEIDHAVMRLSTSVSGRNAAEILETTCRLVPEYVPSSYLLESVTMASHGSL